MNSEEDKKDENNKTPLSQKNEEEKIYKILYSSYGYIKVLEKDLNDKSLSLYKFIQYKNVNNNNNNNNCLMGSIFINNIKDNIDLRIKSFSGKRNIVTCEKININSKLNILIEKLFINDDKNMNNNKENLQYEKNMH